MHHRLRREQQDAEGGNGERAEGEHRPVEHHADQYDGGHDEGALRRHAGARQQQIKQGRGERADRGPFLDRAPAGERRRQRQQCADDEEGDARHHRHVEAGDRQHMGEARHVERFPHRLRDGVAFAGDQRGRDRAAVAGKNGVDALVDGFAQGIETRGVMQPETGRARRRSVADRAQHEAGGAYRRKVHSAGEVVAARPQRLQRRRQMRLEGDEAADIGRGAFAHGDAHALRLHAHPPRGDRRHAHHDAIAARPLLTGFHKAFDLRAPGRIDQHRMGDARGLQGGHRKAGGDGCKAERQRQTDGAAARPHRERNADTRGRQRRPPGRLAAGGEVEDDAEAEGDRQPGRQPPGRELGGDPFGAEAAHAVGRRGDAIGQRQPGAPARGVDAAAHAFARGRGSPAAWSSRSMAARPDHAYAVLHVGRYRRLPAGCG